MTIDKKIKGNRPALFLTGSIVLIVGLVLVLVWWPDVVSFMKGFIGMAVAIGGLVLLYMVKE